MVNINTPHIINDYSSGMIDTGSVSESLLPRNCVIKAVNCLFDSPRGSITGRAGSTLIGNNLSTQIYGLSNFRDAGTGTNHRLLATNGSGITYYLSGATFTSTLAGDTTGLKTRFVTYLDVIARLNGTDAAKSWDGSAAWISGGGPLDVGNWPALTKFDTVFNSRVYTAGSSTYPSRLFYSSIPSSGLISWTSGNGYIDLNPDDGAGNLTGLVTNGTVLLAFKERSMYRWDGSSTFANKLISVGTPSQESVVAHNSGWVYFFGTGLGGVGIYRTTGGYPQLISRNITRWVNAIAGSAYANTAGYCDYDHYYLSVGSLTVDSQVYTNAWLVYTISLQAWHIENRATSFRLFTEYIDSSSNVTIVGGDTSGNVQTINSGTTDNSVPISAECELAHVLITTRARTKIIGHITAYSTLFQGLQALLKVDTGKYNMLGQIVDTEQKFTQIIGDAGMIRGKRFYPKIISTNSQTGFQFDGFELNEMVDEGWQSDI